MRTSVTQVTTSCSFLPHFDVICDILHASTHLLWTPSHIQNSCGLYKPRRSTSYWWFSSQHNSLRCTVRYSCSVQCWRDWFRPMQNILVCQTCCSSTSTVILYFCRSIQSKHRRLTQEALLQICR